MKIIKYMMQVLVVGSLLTSCVEDADVTAYLTEDQLSNVAQDDPDKTFSAAVAGMYSDMQKYYDTDMQHNYFGQKSFDYLTSLMGNDMIMTGRFGMSFYHYLLDYWQQNYTPTNNRWKEYYRVIANANNILKLIDPSSEDPANLKYRAIALGFRGYAYLQLTYLYQHSYYTGADGTKWGRGEKYDFSQSPCVPLITEKTEGDQPRATVAQIYEQIMSDLTTAFSFFKQLDMVHTSSPTDMDGCVVAMHLARANMVIHEWDKAIEYAQVVIDNIPMLTNENQILQGFSNISLPDVVFGCDITADNSTIYASYFSQMDAYSEGYAGIGVWRAAFKPFVDRIADNDIRLQWFCCDRSTGVDTEDKDGKPIRVTLLRDTETPASVEYQAVKFIGTGRENIQAGTFSGWELGDYIYMRSEEAYLIKIEALAHKNSPDAVTELENFMKTRQPDYDYTFTNKADLIEEIIYQKRVEFWGEGLEYIDNRRLNIPVDRTDETWGAENNNHFSAAKFRYNQEERPFLYQLPISEIENNSQISPSDQN